MEKAFEFLKQHRDVAFATVEDNKPKIRVFQIMKQERHTLWFATSPHKEVFQQLQSNPYIELLAMDGNISVRITGKAVFDVPDNICREIYSDNPVLPRLYPDDLPKSKASESYDSDACFEISYGEIRIPDYGAIRP